MSQLSLRKGFVFAAALLLVGAAIAVAVATHGSGATTARTELTRIAKAGDPDAGSAKTKPGEGTPGIARAAAEEYTHKAYPADEIPFQAQVKALNAYRKINAKFQASLTASSILGQLGTDTSKYVPGSWTNVGPKSANYPGVLTFFGADYVASGRTTALAVAPNCSDAKCVLFVGAAGGGIWRTYNALSLPPGQSWQFISGSFGSNSIGVMRFRNGRLYVGTGEPHASGDSEAGLGIWQSGDLGATWRKLPSVTHTVSIANGDYTGDAFAGRAVSEIYVDPNNRMNMWVSSTRAVRGVSSVTGNATSTPPAPRPPFGLFHSTDGGQTFNFVWDGNGTLRGVSRVALDPSSDDIVYASAYQQGVWRSLNGGGTFNQILPPVNPGENTDRAEFAVTPLGPGVTRMYVGDGSTGAPGGEARFFRTDDASGAAVFTDLTNNRNINYCTGQCWYDNFVVTVPGHPNWVYLGGSYQYGEYGFSSNGRAVLYSTDAGVTWSDITADATQQPKDPANCCSALPFASNALHPDQHALVVNPNNQTQVFEGSDGGVMRSSGQFADISSQCDTRPLGPISMAKCHELLSRVPTTWTSLNIGLSTLQFQSLSVNPFNVNQVMGGTQDNGTFQGTGSTWPQIIYGDGGQSGWNRNNPNMRFNSFFGQFHDANVDNGAPTEWYIIGGPIASSPEFSNFYVPIIADPHPARAGTIFEGSQSVWRTQDWGGDPDVLKATCPEFFVSGADPSCGDFVQIGSPSDLTSAAFGADRGACCVAWIARTPSDTGTIWAATNGGRVFVTHNADDPTAANVVWTRIDPLSADDPGRSITSIAIDPANLNHAWISYTGYNFNTPAQPGHVFSVNYNPGGPSATWTNLDAGSLADLPATAVVFDNVRGELYVSNDFGVVRRPAGSSTWTMAGSGLPAVEVAGLTIVPGSRVLYAATHGLGAWKMILPGA
jgi:hypothetical protein